MIEMQLPHPDNCIANVRLSRSAPDANVFTFPRDLDDVTILTMIGADMFVQFRRWLKGIPLVGAILHGVYLRLWCGEGEILTIRDGRMRGIKLRRSIRTTNPRYVSGTYECDLQEALAQCVPAGGVFLTLGRTEDFSHCWPIVF